MGRAKSEWARWRRTSAQRGSSSVARVAASTAAHHLSSSISTCRTVRHTWSQSTATTHHRITTHGTRHSTRHTAYAHLRLEFEQKRVVGSEEEGVLPLGQGLPVPPRFGQLAALRPQLRSTHLLRGPLLHSFLRLYISIKYLEIK